MGLVKKDLSGLFEGPLFLFDEWPTGDVPAVTAGVYTIFEGSSFLYVGMSGRAATAPEISEAAQRGKRKFLWVRLNAHASGRRSGDQFCVYVADRLVLPILSADDRTAIAAGDRSFDSFVRSYVRSHLSFRWLATIDGAQALEIEDEVRRGHHGPQPVLNPIV